MKVAFLYNAFEKLFIFQEIVYQFRSHNRFYESICSVLGDFTILIAFDNLLEAVCNVATVFFAMTYIVLMNLN
jgi:hypothetical protein